MPLCLLALMLALRAQGAPSNDANALRDAPPPSSTSDLQISGYLESYYQYNVNQPQPGLSYYSAFAFRHNNFTLQNASLAFSYQQPLWDATLGLQLGDVGSAYYQSEPLLPANSGAAPSFGARDWKYVQEAYVTYKPAGAGGPLLDGGVFYAPLSPDTLAVHRNWHWTAENIFYATPFYLTGARLRYPLPRDTLATLAVINGWNKIVDNNPHKSLLAAMQFNGASLTGQVLYLGGVERDVNAAAGPYWRHLFDGYLTWQAHARLALRLHLNGGYEPTRSGHNAWLGGALAARLRLSEQVHAAFRIDGFTEQPSGESSQSTRVFGWAASSVGAALATLDYQPQPGLSVRLEWRSDLANAPLYLSRRSGQTIAQAPQPDSYGQHSLTLGATAWF